MLCARCSRCVAYCNVLSSSLRSCEYTPLDEVNRGMTRLTVERKSDELGQLPNTDKSVGVYLIRGTMGEMGNEWRAALHRSVHDHHHPSLRSRLPSMSEPRYSTGMPSGSSHKRTFDAINPDPETDTQHAGRSRRDSPVPSSSREEANRERNKRARNDSDSSYTSELDDILAADPLSPSSSGGSNSSYHSAQSTLPTAASPTLLDESEEDMHMLIDPAVPESHTRPTSPIDDRPTYFELFPGPPRQSQPIAPQSGSYEDIARSLERASAFDREIAPLRSSPAVLPTSSAQGAGPLPPVRLPPGLDDFFPDPYSTREDPLSNRAEGFGMFDGSWLPFERDNGSSSTPTA